MMPLFRWKKTRRYEVSSRNSYVVCVHLLDASLIECTLTADSCGYECLENIAQRIELNELEYFGLWYVNKGLQFRWVELDKPLKKQLDKNACSPLLYFGVMYYVPDAQTIQDDMTRYQYYLQLKSDVIDGKPPCSLDKAILLAAYSVQAELGDYDYERHTVENLKDLVLLPKKLAVDDRSLVELTQDIINCHQTLVGWSSATAEVEYILEVQQLEGYGMGCYSAKDSAGQKVFIGAYYVGIFVKVREDQPPVDQYKWTDVVQLTCSKKHLSIVTSTKDKAINFSLDDPDTARYIHKMFTLQMKFYTGRSMKTTDLDININNRTPDVTDSRFYATTPNSVEGPPAIGNASPASLPSVSSIPNERATVQEDPAITNETLCYSNGSLFTMGQGESQQQLHQPTSNPLPSQDLTQQQSKFVGPALVPYTSNSYLNATPLPPSYRHTPDYETVMRQRMEHLAQVQQQGQVVQTAVPLSQCSISAAPAQLAYLYMHPETLTYSQPDMHQTQASQMSYIRQDFVPGMANGSVLTNVVDSPLPQAHSHYPLRPVDRTSSLIIYPTYASPDITQKSSLPDASTFSTSDHVLNDVPSHYRPPPPYPRPSSSTPDLALQTMRAKKTNSPDLISRRTIDGTGLMVQSFLDQSVENLAMDAQKITLNQQMAAQSKQNLDDSSSIQSEVISQLVQQGGSIPDVACYAMMTQDYPATSYVVNSSQLPGVPREDGGSSRSLAQPVTFSTTGPQGDYNASELISFDNPAFSENLKYYMGEVQASTNVDLSHITPELSQVVVTQQVIPDHVVMPLVMQESAPATKDVQTAANVVLRKKPKDVKEEDRLRKNGQVAAQQEEDDKERKRLSIGALKLAAMNGLTLSRGSVLDDAADSPTEETPGVQKDETRKQLEAKLEAGQVFAEFENVEKKRLKSECSAAGQPINKNRNRFRNVFPYDDNRIKLTTSKENPMGYINASSIKLKIGNQELFYIAAMGPLSNTVNDFWQMIWEQEVEVIAMLTKLQEHDKQKCHRYWPEKKGPKNKVQHAQYQITLNFSNDSGPYTTSGLMVKHLPSNRERLVWHLQYTDWPDHGCPDDVHGFLAFLDEIEAVKRQTKSNHTDGYQTPVLTHCSAGVGRTGVVILTEAIKMCLANNQEINVPGMLSKLREQRMYMVQTVSQYGFVYKTLIEYLKGSRLI